MSQSYIKIWVHAIWAPKYRKPLISSSIEHRVHQFISDQLHKQGCPVRIVNGMPDHVHCLFLLSLTRFSPPNHWASNGFGLSPSYDIIKAHGGSLSLASSDKGTIFTITIPLV